MILHNYNSTSPRRVRIYLAEKALDVPTVNVDIFKGEQRTPEFQKKNPFGGVPVLELDDGTCIAESMAICRYFEALHPDPPLFGTSPLEKAMVEVWIRRIELYLLMPVGQVWINDSPVTRGLVKDPDLKAAEAGRKRVHGTYERLDAHLAGHRFLAGDVYTAADASGLAILDFAAKRVAVPYADDLVNLKRWHDLVGARPSARAGLPADTEAF